MPSARELPPYQLDEIQRSSLHAIAQHKPLGVAVVPVEKGQEPGGKLIDASIAFNCTDQHEKAKKFDPDSFSICYIVP